MVRLTFFARIATVAGACIWSYLVLQVAINNSEYEIPFNLGLLGYMLLAAVPLEYILRILWAMMTAEK